MCIDVSDVWYVRVLQGLISFVYQLPFQFCGINSPSKLLLIWNTEMLCYFFLPLDFPPVKGFTALLYFYWYVICTRVSPRTIRWYCTWSRSRKILLRNLDNWQCRGQYLYHGYYYHCNPTCWRRDLKLAPSCFWCRQKFLLTCNIITVFLLARQTSKWMNSSKVWS